MKQQTTALILSALLLSTLAHGPHPQQDKHHKSLQGKGHSVQHRKSFLHNYRDNNDNDQQQHCRLVCDDSDDGNDQGDASLLVLVNKNHHLFGVANNTAKVGWIIDVSAKLVALFNGASGAVVIYSFQENRGFYFQGGSGQGVWNGNQSFKSFFRRFTSLKVTWELVQRGGQSFDKNSVNDNVQKEIANVIIHLSVDYYRLFKNSALGAFDAFLGFSSRVLVVFDGSLKNFFDVFQGTEVSIRDDILKFVGVLEGMEAFFKEFKGGLDLLVKKSIKFNLKYIFDASSGSEVFVYIVTEMLKVGVEDLKEFFSSEIKLMELLVKLGGNTSKGVTGVFKVILAVMKVINGQTPDILIEALIDFSAANAAGISLQQQFRASVKALVQLGEKIYSSGANVCLTFLMKLQKLESSFVIKGVNISTITLLLINSKITGLSLIVKILVEMKAVTSFEVSISMLLFGLIIRANTASGLYLLQVLIPQLHIDPILEAGSVGILALILKKVDVKVIDEILKGDFSGIPVISVIYNALKMTVKAVASVDVAVIFKASFGGKFLSKIVAFFKAILKGAKIDFSLSFLSKESSEGGEGDSNGGDENSNGGNNAISPANNNGGSGGSDGEVTGGSSGTSGGSSGGIPAGSHSDESKSDESDEDSSKEKHGKGNHHGKGHHHKGRRNPKARNHERKIFLNGHHLENKEHHQEKSHLHQRMYHEKRHKA